MTNADDATTTNRARLSVTSGYIKNISLRIVVPDNGLLIAGFVIDTPKTVLIRSVGKTLEGFGVPAGTTMPNPKIEIYKGTAVTASHDDCIPTAAGNAAAAGVGAFAITSAHAAALLITLSAGAYPVQISPVGGKGGGALVEVYEIN